MKLNDVLKITAIAGIILISISVAYYYILFLPSINTSTDSVSATLKCNELYELKKSKYWGEKIGQNKAIYNADLNTCLAMNMHLDFSTSEYYAMVIDMSDDSALTYYSATPKGFYFEGDNKITCEVEYDYYEVENNGNVNKEYGCEKMELFNKLLQQVKSYGFKVSSGLL